MDYFFPDTTRGVIKALMYQFSDIHVKNFDAGAKTVTGSDPRPHKPWAKDIRVPIKFGTRDKTYDTRVEDRYGNGEKYYIILPSCALELTGVNYAPNRQNNINQLRHFYDNESDLNTIDSYFEDEMPLAFDFTFRLSFKTDNLNHYSQINEQILYNFRPNMVIAVKEFSFINLERDLNVQLNGTGLNFSSELAEDANKSIEFSYDLTVHGFIYSPIKSETLVKEIQTSIHFIKPDQTIQLDGDGWLSRPVPKPQDSNGLTPYEAVSGNQSDDNSFIRHNAASGSQVDIQITQKSTYYGYGPKLNNATQTNTTTIELDFDSYVDDTFSISNFIIEGVTGQTQPDSAVLKNGDPDSTLVLSITNLNTLAPGDEFAVKFSGLTRNDYPGPPRRIELIYQ